MSGRHAGRVLDSGSLIPHPVKYRPTLLMVLDGWGVRDSKEDNAIRIAKTPRISQLSAQFSMTRLQASGEFVGLPKGLMGNSEVGHLNIGAGRIVYQDIVRISRSIADGTFFKNDAFLEVFDHAQKNGGTVHLLGLVSDGGVHSSLEHLLALIKLASMVKCKSLSVHAFLDGRDTPPKSARPYLGQVEAALNQYSIGKIATVSGRYYAMDRDKRWERLEKAYRALVFGEGESATTPFEALDKDYARGETDEFVLPTVIASEKNSLSKIQDGDGVIFFNFRADRARQLTAALTQKGFVGFNLPQPKIVFCSMTEYDPTFNIPVAFKKQNFKNTLPEVWSHQKLRQFHVAETEKYAHVTYFFAGGREAPFPGEERFMVPSPKVATYDLTPEMSARQITSECLSRIAQNTFDCIVMNFANADMVGHTGNLEKTIQAVETVDDCVGTLVDAIIARGGLTVITADHGNAEIMKDASTQQPHTAHTTSLVPCIFVGSGLERKELRSDGILADVAPTILELQGLPVPAEMTGKSLVSA